MIRHTVDGGKTWEVQHVKPFDAAKNYGLQWLQFLNAQTGWAGGNTTGDMGNVTGILHTTDGGKTWKETMPKELLTRVCFLNDSVGVGVGYVFLKDSEKQARPGLPDYDGVITLTLDGGQNWKEVYRLKGKTIYDVVFTKDGSGWALGEGVMLRYRPG